MGIAMSPLLASIMVIAALALVVGGVRLYATGRARVQGALMIAAALVILANLVILLAPLQHNR